MARFRKKPVEIDAVIFLGVIPHEGALMRLLEGHSYRLINGLHIKTLEGWITASPGDWIIKGVAGEIYPCKPEIFNATYEAVEVKPNHRLHDHPVLAGDSEWPHRFPPCDQCLPKTLKEGD